LVVDITSRGLFPQRIHGAQLVGLMGLVVVHMQRIGVDIVRRLLFSGRVIEAVEGASDGLRAAVEDVGVDHRGSHAAVPEQGLHGTDVVAVLEQVGRERVAEGVAGRAFGEARCDDRCSYGALNHRFVEVMAA